MTYNRRVPKNRWWRRVFTARVFALILCGGVTPVLDAQVFGFIKEGPGLRLDSISLDASYSLLPAPNNGPQSSSNVEPLMWDTRFGLSASAGWAKMLTNGSLSLNYNGGFGRRLHSPGFSDSHQMAHFGYSYSKVIKPRWTYTAGLGAELTDFQSYFLSPAGTLATSSNTSQLGATGGIPISANGTVQPSAITQSALFGGRFITSSLTNSLSYAASPRLSYSLGLDVTRFQNLDGSSDPTDLNSTRGVLNQGMYGNANFSMNYLLDPRTHIGASLGMGHSFSRFEHPYYNTLEFQLGRTLQPWWELDVSGGAGFSGQTRPTFRNPRPVGGINTRFSGFSQSISLAATASIDDSFAIGASRTYTGGAVWEFHPDGSHWSFFENNSVFLTKGNADASFSSWSASGGISRVLTDHLFIAVSAHYASFDGQLLNNLAAASGLALSSAFGDQAYRGVQMSLTWAPSSLKW